MITIDGYCPHEDAPCEIIVEAYAVSLGYEGRTWGPPERCYPSEAPEVEIESAVCACCDREVTLTSAQERQVTRMVVEAAREDAAEAWAEARMP